MITPVEAQPRLISSMARAYETLSAPAPPHSSGTATPISPSSPSLRTASTGKWCSSSQRRALGTSSRSANSRQVSRSIRWVSVSSKSITSSSERRSSSPAGERGRPLLEEGAHSFLLILRSEEHAERLLLQGVRRARIAGRGLDDHPLERGDRQRALGGDLLGDGLHALAQRVRGENLQDQADLLRLLRRDHVTGEAELQRAHRPDLAGEPLRAAETGDDGEV